MKTARPCLFLDRDGVIIHNVPYGKSANDVRLRPGAAALLRKAQDLGHHLIVVTNQSGLGRGWVELHEYEAITARMEEQLLEQKVRLDAIYFAGYHAEAKDPRWLEKSHWRKPEPGMFRQAAEDFAIDFRASTMIGDRESDLLAAERAGVGRKILIASPEFPNEIERVASGIEFEYYQEFEKISL